MLQLQEKGQWSSPNAMPHYLHGNDEAKQDAQLKRIERASKSDTAKLIAPVAKPIWRMCRQSL